MALPSASVEVVKSGQTRFNNAVDGDMAIYTNAATQKIHVGTLLGGTSALTIANAQVQVNSNLDLQGTLTHQGNVLVDADGHIVDSYSLPLNGGIMTGQIQGSATDVVSAPAYAWAGDTTTGLFNKSLGNIGVSCQGVETANFSSTGITAKGLRLSN